MRQVARQFGGLPVTQLRCMRALTAGICAVTWSAGVLVASQQKKPVVTTLSFPAVGNEHVEVRCSPSQQSWKLRFDPDFDQKGQPVVVSLSLVGKRNGGNLFDRRPSFRGLQPFDFAARDLLNGVSHSAFGKSRRLTLPNSAGVILISLDRAVIDTREGAPYVKALNLSLKVFPGSRAAGCQLKPRLR